MSDLADAAYRLESMTLPVGTKGGDLHLTLHRYDSGADVGQTARKPVLLLHGASGNHGTFLVPSASGGVAGWLAERGFDPWLLDWRGSGLVVDDPSNHSLLAGHGEIFNFNTAAQYDVPAAICAIRKQTGDAPMAALGFCMGSAVLAEAVALGHVKPSEVDCVVLMTLGLFYETSADGRLKSEERVLERLVGEAVDGQPFLSVDPRAITDQDDRVVMRAPWPKLLENLYTSWPSRLKFHGDARPGVVQENCNRLGFMYGTPYHHGNLVDEIHGTSTVKATLPDQFGAIPLHMYIHAARNLRQGHATVYDPEGEGEALVSDEARARFAAMKKVTLMTGAVNQLWHRNSIDLMYEWLRRGTSARSISKAVLRDYGHQDLLWGRASPSDVYCRIRDGLCA